MRVVPLDDLWLDQVEGPAKGQHQDQGPRFDQQAQEQQGKADDRCQAVISPEPFQESGHKRAAVR